MNIVLVTGGARAGKSCWAAEEATRIAGPDVAFVATAERRDQEMADRIAAHRLDRHRSWITIEVPLEVPRAVRDADRPVVIVDCMTLWVSNLLLAADAPGGPAAGEPVGFDAGGPVGSDAGGPVGPVRAEVESLLEVAADRTGTLIVVTNEVGLGLVPDNALARIYRDLLGWANARVAGQAERVVLLVAGIPVELRGDRLPSPPSATT